MEITEEQRKRAEANRLAALEKRKAATAIRENPWSLFKCRKVSPELAERDKLSFDGLPKPPNHLSERFRVRLEICSPDSFSITPEPLPNSPYPGEAQCLQKIYDLLSFVLPSHYTQNSGGGKASVYKLGDYDMVIKSLKKFQGVELQEIPWRTLNVMRKFLHSFVSECWIPCTPEHLSDDDVDALIAKLPKFLFNALLPFQLDGLRFGLRRGGCCLIADEMGLGKTIQAIAIACCFINEGPVLVVCPAILRFSWAEELERWLSFCSPTDIHLVFGHQDNPAQLSRCPRIVVISYTMLYRLRKSILGQEWALLIVDESHHVRSSKKPSEPEEIKAVLDVATKVKRKVLLSGTPSLSRPFDIFHQINILWPGLLGTNKYDFAKSYCAVKVVHGAQGRTFQDFSQGVRLEELNVLLKQTVMIRRLKEHVLVQLPPKRRQVIRLMLTRMEIAAAFAATRMNDNQEIGPIMNDCTSETDAEADEPLDISDEYDDKSVSHKSSRQLTSQQLGVAKLSGFHEWLSIHPIVTESENSTNSDVDLCSQKMIIFAHHLKVLDGIQEIVCEKGIGFVRIDGNTLARDRQSAVRAFQSTTEVKIAIIGITAGGVGLDFSSARNVVFLELPRTASDMLQAEDRAHRRGQTNAVNIYIFCAKDTSDESVWLSLNKSLRKVSSVMNGKYDAVQEIAVETVSDLGYKRDIAQYENLDLNETVDLYPGAPGSNPASETDNITGKNGLRENAASDELSDFELPTSQETAVSLTMQPVGTCDETSEKSKDTCVKQDNANANSSKHTYSLHIESDSNFLDEKGGPVYDVEMFEDTLLNKSIKDHTSEVLIIGSQEAHTDCEMDDATDRIKGLEHVALEGILVSTADSETSTSQNTMVNMEMEANRTYTETSGRHENEPTELAEADECYSMQADDLRFEVSRYTGRIHLYTCIPGNDTRPRLLKKNFRPEEVESLNLSAADIGKRTDEEFVKVKQACKDILQTFIKEWNDLRPIDQKKLLGKPLQLPLSSELWCLKESINHGSGGLLKGGSKRRNTPLNDISNPLPENASWKKISLCSGRKKEKEYTQGWNELGEPLCKLCQTPCKSKLSKTPEFFEDLFCNLVCFQEYRIRTSRRSLREELFNMEHGVCAVCKLDCHKLIQYIRPLKSVARRQEYVEKVAPKLASHKKLLHKLVHDPVEGNAWHADHIIPVHRGGGECNLDNMRTLCVACHLDVTKAQCKERRLDRKRAKERVKGILKDLKDCETTKQANHCWKNLDELEVQEDDEDELLIKVPGSAYSRPALGTSD